MQHLHCSGALTADQLLEIARARCLGCKHWQKTGENIHHTCWRDPYYMMAAGVISPERFDLQMTKYLEAKKWIEGLWL